jgi:hypothetical protein
MPISRQSRKTQAGGAKISRLDNARGVWYA